MGSPTLDLGSGPASCAGLMRSAGGRHPSGPAQPVADMFLALGAARPAPQVVNCGDNTGAKNLFIIAVTQWGARLNRLPAACVGDFCLASVKKGKPELRKKGASRGRATGWARAGGRGDGSLRLRARDRAAYAGAPCSPAWVLQCTPA